MYEQFSNAFIAERASCSTLPFCIDDPPSKSKGSDVNDLIVTIRDSVESLSEEESFPSHLNQFRY